MFVSSRVTEQTTTGAALSSGPGCSSAEGVAEGRAAQYLAARRQSPGRAWASMYRSRVCPTSQQCHQGGNSIREIRGLGIQSLPELCPWTSLRQKASCQQVDFGGYFIAGCNSISKATLRGWTEPKNPWENKATWYPHGFSKACKPGYDFQVASSISESRIMR